MKTVAIIQARMGSSRLFNKMLLNFHGYSIIDWIYHRVLEAKKIDQLIFALPNSKRDDVLSRYLESIGATVYRGSENDLVDRYFQAAKVTNANQVVRICADNPLICGSEIDRLVYFFDNNNFQPIKLCWAKIYHLKIEKYLNKNLTIYNLLHSNIN